MELKEKYEKNTKTDYIYPSQRRIFKECYSGEMSGTAPTEIQVYFHDFGKDKEMTARRMYVDSGKLPLMTITEGQCQGIFAAAGYSVGMADMLVRIFEA